MTNVERQLYDQFGYSTDSLKTEYLLELAEDATKKLYMLDKMAFDLDGDAYECAVSVADVADKEYSENAWDIWCHIVRHIVYEEIEDDKRARAYFLSRCNWRSMTELYFTSGVEAHRIKDEEELDDNWAELTKEMFIGFFTADAIMEERRMQEEQEAFRKYCVSDVVFGLNGVLEQYMK